MDSINPSEQPGTRSAFGPQVKLGPTKPVVEIVPASAPKTDLAPIAGSQDLVPSEIGQAKNLPEPMPLSGWIKGELTPEQRAHLDLSFKKARAGTASSVPMVCHGNACPFIAMCPLAQAQVPLPVKEACPVEEATITAWKRDFITYLNVPDDHPNKGLIFALIDDLAISAAMQNRVLWANANEPDIFRDEVIGANQHGDPIVAKRLNASLDLLSRISAGKMKILRELLATPRAEVEAKRKLGMDPSSQAAATMAKIKNLNGAKKVEAAYLKVELDGPRGE